MARAHSCLSSSSWFLFSSSSERCILCSAWEPTPCSEQRSLQRRAVIAASVVDECVEHAGREEPRIPRYLARIVAYVVRRPARGKPSCPSETLTSV
jgi:hypothetical protein